MKKTKGVIEIQKIIQASKRPISSAEILVAVKGLGTPINRATVYRIIARLVQEGDVYEVNLGDDKKRYEWHGEHHHHLVCTHCRSITPVHTCGAEELAEREARRVGFQLRSHSLEYFGLCSKCR